MASFTALVRNITGSSTTETSNAQLYTFIQNGIRYVFNSLPVQLLALFCKDSSAITTSAGYSLTSDRIISVRRGSYLAKEIPLTQMHMSASDSASIYRASIKYPQYYILNKTLYIKPNSTTGSNGYITYVPVNGFVNAISATTVSPTSVTSVNINVISNPIIHYAAGLDFMGLSVYWMSKGVSTIATAGTISASALTLAKTYLATGIGRQSASDALIKAQSLIDNKSGLSDTNTQTAEYYLGDDQEDSEMVSAMLQTAAQEINRAHGNLQQVATYIQAAGAQINRALVAGQTDGTFKVQSYRESAIVYLGKSKQMFELAGSELKNYIESDTAYMTMRENLRRTR